MCIRDRVYFWYIYTGTCPGSIFVCSCGIVTFFCVGIFFVRYNLEVIEEQFGAIIRGIVEDRLLLERLPEPTSSASYVAIQQVMTTLSDAYTYTPKYIIHDTEYIIVLPP